MSVIHSSEGEMSTSFRCDTIAGFVSGHMLDDVNSIANN